MSIHHSHFKQCFATANLRMLYAKYLLSNWVFIQGMQELIKCKSWMSLWMKVSAKCINTNVILHTISTKCLCRLIDSSYMNLFIK